MINVRTPKITSLETAVRIYWENTEIGTAEMTELFGAHGKDLFSRLKKRAREVMAEKHLGTFGAYTVSTTAAYEAWGLDINDLEARLKKIQKLEKAREKVG